MPVSTAAWMRFNRVGQKVCDHPLPLGAYGHMPFVGHRTVKQHWDREAAAVKRNQMAMRQAAAYGCEPQYVPKQHGGD